MVKDYFYSYKTWLVFSILLAALLVVTFNSVRAAKPDFASYEVDSWTSSGYKEVTVALPKDAESYIAAPQAECVLDTNGMISHWPLDEGAGATIFVDVAGSKNGTCAGIKCPEKTSGRVGGAFNFNASEQDVISIPSDAIYDTMANGDFSAGVWVRTTQTCAEGDELKNKVFFGRYRNLPTNGTWWLGCTEPGGVAVFRLRDSNNIPRQINGTSKITDGFWHYIVGVRDAGSDKNYLYVDGQLEGMLDSPLYTGNFSSDDPITMGAYDEFTN